MGQSDLNDEEWGENGQQIDIKDFKPHENYDNTSAYFDIGIIYTAKDINFTDDTKPICFSDQPFKPEQLLKKNFGLVGWKKDLKNNFKLSSRHLQVYNQETCNEKYDIQEESTIAQERKKKLPNLLTQATFCAGSNVRSLAIILRLENS